MQQFHTVIVGAGPGGLACATRLAQEGVDVLVLERNKTIGPKVCAGGIPPNTLALGIPDEILERRFPEQYISTNLQHTVIRSDSPIICTVDRQRLGQWMADTARAAGATIRTDVNVEEITKDCITTRAGKIGFQFLVGADGSNSLVRRFLGIPVEKMGVGIHYQVPGNFPRMEWHLHSKYFGSGYGWIFPHKENASIGAYASKAAFAPVTLKKNFLNWAHHEKIALGGLPVRSGFINYDFRGWHFDNIFLVGDAAGVASALTGEGIYSAMVSGMESAETILNPGHESAPMAALLQKHEKHVRRVARACRSRVSCRLMMEGLVLALRTGMTNFKTLEMGIDEVS